MKNISLIFLCLSLSACGFEVVGGLTQAIDRHYVCHDGEVSGPGVINGQRVQSDSMLGRGVVFLIHEDGTISGSMEVCTGSLIGENMVLTAAHCVISGSDATRAQNTKIFFDNDPLCTLSQSKMERIRVAEAVILHPDYKGTRNTGADLALIRFNDRAPANTKALKVAKEFVSLAKDDAIYAAGFGKTVDWAAEGGEPIFLRIAQIKMQNGEPNFGVLNTPNSPVLIFDQRGDQSLCRGDSGGPAMAFDRGVLKIIGVASYVDSEGPGGSCHNFVVHTSLSHYNDWLIKTYDRLATAKSSENPFKQELTN